MFTLLIDTREPKNTEDLMRSFDSYAPFRSIDRSIITIKTQQLSTGDFQILHDDKVLAILERKTLNDYASSLKDGRHSNVNNLLVDRESLGAHLYYIIEGNAFAPHDKLYSRMPYSTIEQSIFGLMIRHQIMIMRTQCPKDTCRAILALMMKYINVSAESGSSEESYINTSLLDPVAKQAIKMILVLGRIKLAQALKLLENNSIYDLLNGRINLVGTIDALPSTITNKIERGLTIYEQRLMLSRVAGISETRAKKIITPELPLSDFVEYNAPSLHEYSKEHNLKLSVKAIQDIRRCLLYKMPQAVPTETSEGSSSSQQESSSSQQEPLVEEPLV
jgi:ERCC4-type nuclease